MIKRFISSIRNKVPTITNKYTWIKNKYILTLFFFTIWLCFIDNDSFITQHQLSKQYKKLEHRKEKLEKKVQDIKEELKNYKENPALLEKYARENYLMKKDNETIFIFHEGEMK